MFFNAMSPNKNQTKSIEKRKQHGGFEQKNNELKLLTGCSSVDIRPRPLGAETRFKWNYFNKLRLI